MTEMIAEAVAEGTNATLKALAAEHRFRTARLEDGELVIRLRGKALGKYAHPSDHPHAGMWGERTMYVLVPCKWPARRARIALGLFPTLEDRSSDAELLLLGPVEGILRLVTDGPEWCRARNKKLVSEADQAHLAGIGITKSNRASRMAAPA